jgi:hypothetical protein
MRGVAGKNTYLPSRDIKENYHHRILFGASAGVDRQYADQRVLMHHGAGFISLETARQQIEYLDDAASEQDKIDRETLGKTIFQRFAADPSTPLAVAAEAFVEMGKGKSWIEAVETVAPQLVKQAKEEQQAPGAATGELPLAEAPTGEEQAAALEPGSQPEQGAGPGFAPLEFAPPPLQQQIVTNR